MKGIEKRYYNPNFANFYNLNEGLIQFYSIDKVANHLKSKFTNVIDVVNHAVNIYRLPSNKPTGKHTGSFVIKIEEI